MVYCSPHLYSIVPVDTVCLEYFSQMRQMEVSLWITYVLRYHKRISGILGSWEAMLFSHFCQATCLETPKQLEQWFFNVDELHLAENKDYLHFPFFRVENNGSSPKYPGKNSHFYFFMRRNIFKSLVFWTDPVNVDFLCIPFASLSKLFGNVI